MIRATPNDGFPPVIINSDVQFDIEDIMIQLGYRCTDYTLEMVEYAADGDLDACDVLDSLISVLQKLKDQISRCGKYTQKHESEKT
ncbi:hypothetical protein LCGC14_1557140 [marine sediment metagenome]|uniref:Uncharacterized protein n=1 Tax=marine sediment metagenome TaxID=412755 RepID=A0A0F9INJ5_9ZZZZ